MVSRNLELFPKLIVGLWSDRLIRMRAADAAEKVTRKNPELLAPYRKELLGWLGEIEEQELRWQLARHGSEPSAASSRVIPRTSTIGLQVRLVTARARCALSPRRGATPRVCGRRHRADEPPRGTGFCLLPPSPTPRAGPAAFRPRSREFEPPWRPS
jgi:hypothetical protein